MIRVLHIISNLEVGGAETMLTKLIGGSDQSRFQHEVVSLGPRGTLAGQLEASGATVHALGLSLAKLPLALPRLKRICRAFEPDWIQGWMIHGNLAARALRRAFPDAGIAWNVRHTLDDLSNERMRTRALIRLSASWSKQCDVIIYNSVKGAEDHERIGYPSHCRRVIPNGFDLGKFQPAPEARRETRGQLGLREDALVVGNIARFHPMKHQTQLIRAAARLPEVEVVIAGLGADNSNRQLLGLAEELGVRERIHLIGLSSKVERLYPAFDIFCLCSQAVEGFPNVVGEAMSCGVPCVVTDIGDAGRLVGDSGLVVPGDNLEALIAALSEMIDRIKTEREALATACRNRIVSEFGLTKIIGEYESLYASIQPKIL